MRVSVMWGAKYLLLLETARGVITQSRGEQVRPFARWEPSKYSESLRETIHGESNPVNPRAMDESTIMEFTELIVKPAISPFAPMPEQEEMPEILHRSDWEESAQELLARRVLQTTTTTDTGTCDEGETFSIASTVLPEVEGCYNDTGTVANDEVFYTETGEVGSGQNIVQAFELNGDATDVRWIVAFEASSDTTSMEENVLYCFSSDLAADVHPADVEIWFCFTNGPDEPEIVSTEDFSTSCGCSITSEPSTIAPSPFVGVTVSPSPVSRDMMPSAGPTPASRGMMPSAGPTPASRGMMPSAGPTPASRGIMPSASPSAVSSVLPTGFMETSSPSPLSESSPPTSSPTPSSRSVETPSSTSSPSSSPTPSSTASSTAPTTASSTAPSTNFGHRSITMSTSVTVAVGFAATVVHLVGL